MGMPDNFCSLSSPMHSDADAFYAGAKCDFELGEPGPSAKLSEWPAPHIPPPTGGQKRTFTEAHDDCDEKCPPSACVDTPLDRSLVFLLQQQQRPVHGSERRERVQCQTRRQRTRGSDSHTRSESVCVFLALFFA
jgi:hypothetical protein